MFKNLFTTIKNMLKKNLMLLQENYMVKLKIQINMKLKL